MEATSQQHLKTRYIYIDAESFRKEGFDWGGAKFSKLIEFAQQEHVRLLVTDITRGEVLALLKENLGAALTAARKHEVVFRQLGGLNLISKMKNEAEGFSTLKTAFEKFLSDVKAIDIPIAVDAKLLIQDYFNKSPPFSEKKKGEFPDAIAISSLLEWCKQRGTSTYVVSGDPDLLQCCAASELLHYAPAVAEIISHATVSKDTQEQVTDYLSESEELIEQLEDSLSGKDVTGAGGLGMSLTGEVFRVNHAAIHGVNIYEREGNKLICEVEFEAEPELRMLIHKNHEIHRVEQSVFKTFFAEVVVLFNPSAPKESKIESVEMSSDPIEVDEDDIERWY